ncbi:hypothetical protein LXA43DRAFT_428582 [Ganoderma leucocontextum]|nr:hypothetical protein LXA43DRAFT_428582 [Ganoderma leucocontextum]
MLNKAPWELYAKAMFNLSGFPLWHADPEIDENFGRREVELGSVGFLDRGKFRHLFNARKGEDDPFNAGRVPSTFEQFNPPNLSITAPKPILRQSYITSGSVRELTVSLEGGAESPVANLVSAGGSVSFKCKQNAGALLVFDQPGVGQSIPTKRYIVTYLRAHMDSWFEWANEGLSYDVRREDIKFVFGTIKTTRWACAAFSGS